MKIVFGRIDIEMSQDIFDIPDMISFSKICCKGVPQTMKAYFFLNSVPCFLRFESFLRATRLYGVHGCCPSNKYSFGMAMQLSK